MRSLHGLICILALATFLVQQAGAATTFHVYATADNVSPNYSTIQAAVTASAAGDTISIDDSTTYTVADSSNYIKMNKNDLTIVAKAGETPVIRHTYTGSSAGITIQRPGCRLGSLSGGTIIIDGAGVDQRGIDLQFDVPSYFTAASTTTLENLVFRNGGVVGTNSAYFAVRMYASATTPLPEGTVLNFRYLDFQFPAGQPNSAILPTRTSDYVAFLLRLQGGAVANFENVRSNTLTGYFLTMGDENQKSVIHSGTVNMRNCKIVFDDPGIVNDARMGCPIALMNMYTGAPTAGFTLNMDNCYIRSDAAKSGTLNEADILPVHTSADTSNSLGAISLMNYSSNVLNVTNSAIVGCGAGINVDTTHSAITLTNSDIYVPTAAQVTPGYFVNLSARSVSITHDHQCVATRCNLYGLAGSQIQTATRNAGSVFSMVTCNDWSPTNAYASNWVTSGCVNPGANPGYGAMNSEADCPGVAYADFTVYNQAVKLQNIGSNRVFDFGVPVELSTFSAR